MPQEQDAEAPKEPNILGAALDKFFGGVEESQGLDSLQVKDEKEPVIKEQEKKVEEKKEQPPVDDEEEEVDKFNVEDIRTKGGVPISQNAKEKFKKLENSRERWRKRAEEHQKKLEEFEQRLKETEAKASSLQDNEEYKKLVEENQKLKEQHDLLFFEQSDEWKSTFELPIKNVTDRINGLISSVVKTLTPKHKSDLASLLQKANLLLGSKDSEAEFDSIVDSITDDILTGTAGAKFSRSMQEIWELSLKRNEAKQNKELAREKITSQKRELIEKSRKSLEEMLALQEVAFEKTPVGQALSTVFGEKFDYKTNKEIGRKQVFEAIDIFTKTGVVTPELSEVLHHATLKRVHDKEREFLVAGYNTMAQLSEQQQKKIAELEARIIELRGGIGRNVGKTTEEPKKKQGEFSIVDRLNETIAQFAK